MPMARNEYLRNLLTPGADRWKPMLVSLVLFAAAAGGAVLTRENAVVSAGMVVLALGERPTSGYWADIQGAQVSGDTLYVQGVANRPAADAMTAQMITYPYAIALIDKTRVRVVRSEIRSVQGEAAPWGQETSTAVNVTTVVTPAAEPASTPASEPAPAPAPAAAEEAPAEEPAAPAEQP